jgi:hypothetical protein
MAISIVVLVADVIRDGSRWSASDLDCSSMVCAMWVCRNDRGGSDSEGMAAAVLEEAWLR